MKKLTTALLFMAVHFVYAQNPLAYKIYNSKGKPVSYKKMIKKLDKADVLLFGELHNNSIAHWLQLEVAKSLDQKNDLIFGAEMFERDNEDVLQQYMRDEIDAKALDTLARLWRNFSTDYKPLVDYAKANGINYYATNIPRRYASLVYREDFGALEKLTEEEKSWIAPLPIAFDIALPGYQNMLSMGGGMNHGGENFPKAQAIKDATMAHFILQNYKANHLFIHLNGSYHSDNHGDVKGEGIIWYMQQRSPELNYMNITSVEQDDIKKLNEEHLGKADYIICIPSNMTKTYTFSF